MSSEISKDIYSEKAVRHFMTPRNTEPLSDLSGVGCASSDTLEDEVEPFLLRSELIVRTRRGRIATDKAYRHLKREPPSETA